jgi:ubiquitin-like 1-activating enzyme E1 A
MADTNTPSAVPPPATNGTFPAEDAAGQTVAAIAEADKISAGKSDCTAERAPLRLEPDEIALYDRQIRLWGVQAQEK